MQVKNLLICVSVILLFVMRKRATAKVKELMANYRLSKDFELIDLIKTSQPFANIPNEAEKKELQKLVNNVLQPASDLIKSAGGKIVTNSGFRSEEVNKAVGGVPNSQHRLGQACDFHTPGLDLDKAFQLIKSSIKIPFDQLILETGSRGERWIHISTSIKPRFVCYYANFNSVTKKMDYVKVA